jgi:hypothetical protein
MSMTLVGVTRRGSMIDLRYGEVDGDPEPFILTVTAQFVAQEIDKTLPISGPDLQAYLLTHVSKLQATAENCRARGMTSEVL